MGSIYLVPIEMDDALTDFQIRTELEGVSLVLRFTWQERSDRWFVTIMTAEEEVLLAGLPLHVNLELIERFEVEGLPSGRLMLYDGSGGNTECGRYDLGDRCVLLYEATQ